MNRKYWTIAALAVLLVVAGLLAQRSGAQSGRVQVPQFDPDPLWSQALPNRWVTGQVGGVAVDSHDNSGCSTGPRPSPTAKRPLR